MDGAQLPLAVYAARRLIRGPGCRCLRRPWHLHRGEEMSLGHVLRLDGREYARETVRGGDLGLWRYGSAFSYGGVSVGKRRVGHAVRGEGVMLADLDIDAAPTSRPARLHPLPGPTMGLNATAAKPTRYVGVQMQQSEGGGDA